MTDFGSYCLTEPGAGSDAAAITTSAIRDGRRLRAHRRQAVHLRRRRGIRLRRHGAHRRARCPRDHAPSSCRATPPGLSFGANEKKMGWNAQPTRQVILDEVRVPASATARRRGPGLQDRDVGAQRRPHQHRRLLARRGAVGARPGRAVRARALHVRRAARREAVRRLHARRHGDRAARGARARARCRARARREGAGRRDAVRDGQALRDRRRLPHRQRGAAAARRLRLPARVRHREGRARPAGASDPRGHERDHARHHRARAARGSAR